uniref:Uncharacterized protein n=1 Tax=Picea glauca TaxID=3330 RepID=A0A101LY25_PICGL|nr:hypothetical protein ABT39_MTgene5662 [Picea glauca]
MAPPSWRFPDPGKGSWQGSSPHWSVSVHPSKKIGSMEKYK